MIEVELAIIVLVLLTLAWLVAGLQESLWRFHFDLLRAVLDNHHEPAAKADADWAVKQAKESVKIMDAAPLWRRRLLMLKYP